MRLDVIRQLAHAMAQAGVASLRYHKRGVGESRRLRDGTTERAGAWRTGSHEAAATCGRG
jgi:alpha/beta superfamily hydrolase